MKQNHHEPWCRPVLRPLAVGLTGLAVIGWWALAVTPHRDTETALRPRPDSDACCVFHTNQQLGVDFQYPTNWRVVDHGELIAVIPPWSESRPPYVQGDFGEWPYAIRLSKVGLFNALPAMVTAADLAAGLSDPQRFPQPRVAPPPTGSGIILVNSSQDKPLMEALTAYVPTPEGWLQVNLGLNSLGHVSDTDRKAFMLLLTTLRVQ